MLWERRTTPDRPGRKHRTPLYFQAGSNPSAPFCQDAATLSPSPRQTLVAVGRGVPTRRSFFHPQPSAFRLSPYRRMPTAHGERLTKVRRTSVRINEPMGLAFDTAADLFILDGNHLRIRMVDTNGIITTVAGSGNWGYAGEGSRIQLPAEHNCRWT